VLKTVQEIQLEINSNKERDGLMSLFILINLYNFFLFSVYFLFQSYLL
jgi:hypothetical protein